MQYGGNARLQAFVAASFALWCVGASACSSNASPSSTSGNPSAPEGWADLTEAERCGLAEDNMQERCGEPPLDEESRRVAVDFCLSDYRQEKSIGCGAQWDAYEACLAAHGPFDCANDEPCSREIDGSFACRSAFASSTGCTPNSRYSECTTELPVPLYCLAAIPTGCVQGSSGDPVELVCCPPFD